jgi:hypothetical protein
MVFLLNFYFAHLLYRIIREILTRVWYDDTVVILTIYNLYVYIKYYHYFRFFVAT